MIPRKFAPMLFVFILSGVMSWLVSGIAALRTQGWGPGYLGVWTGAWLSAWCVAFPIGLVAAPLARRAVDRLTAPH